MLRKPFDWRNSKANRAVAATNEITASIAALHSECLLDLHHIFREKPGSTLAEMAEAEMGQRSIKPQP